MSDCGSTDMNPCWVAIPRGASLPQARAAAVRTLIPKSACHENSTFQPVLLVPSQHSLFRLCPPSGSGRECPESRRLRNRASINSTIAMTARPQERSGETHLYGANPTGTDLNNAVLKNGTGNSAFEVCLCQYCIDRL